MKQLLHLLALGLLVPSTALAQVDAEVAAQCRDARDFYGCVRTFTSPVRRSDDTAPFDGVMGQVAAGLISGPGYRNAPQNFPPGMIRLVLLKGSCGASCAEPTGPIHLWQLARNRSERLVAACLVLRLLTRLRQSLNDDAFICCRITAITCGSESPN